MEDDSSVEDTSDERFAAAHEAVLTKMRDQWAVIKSLKNELGIGTSVPGSHLRRRASFDFTGSLLPQSAADADGSTGLTPGGSLRGSNGSIRALSIDASDAGPATFGSSGPVSALTPANGNLFSSQKKLRRRGPGRPRKRF